MSNDSASIRDNSKQYFDRTAPVLDSIDASSKKAASAAEQTAFNVQSMTDNFNNGYSPLNMGLMYMARDISSISNYTSRIVGSLEYQS